MEDKDSTQVPKDTDVVIASSEDLHSNSGSFPVYSTPLENLEEARQEGYTPIYFEYKTNGNQDN